MKIRQILGVALILAMSGSLSLAHADTIVVGGGDAFTITFNENGNASYQVFDSSAGTYGPVVNEKGFLDANGFLVYRLPEFVGAGDVGILEPTTGALSDGLRFSNDDVSGLMAYFSDNTDGVDAKADTGFPTDFAPVGGLFGGFFVTETGPEGNNGFQYVAGPGDLAGTNFYNGVSDATVPEPTTMALLGGALFALGALRRRRG